MATAASAPSQGAIGFGVSLAAPMLTIFLSSCATEILSSCATEILSSCATENGMPVGFAKMARINHGEAVARKVCAGIVKANGFAKVRLLLAVFQRVTSTFRAVCAPPLSPQNWGDGDKNAGPTFLP
jgi:hypothetical protein